MLYTDTQKKTHIVKSIHSSLRSESKRYIVLNVSEITIRWPICNYSHETVVGDELHKIVILFIP